MNDVPGLRRVAAAWFFLRCQLWFPVWVTFLEHDLGFSLSEIVLADITYSVAVLAMEIPLGVVADTFGHKRTLLLGAAAAALTQFAVPFMGGLTSLILVWGVWALSNTLLSGTETAYRYEIIRSAGEPQREIALFGRFNAIQAVALLLTHSVAGALYAIHPALPFAANGACALVALALLAGAPDVPVVESAKSGARAAVRGLRALLLEDRVARLFIVLLSVSAAYFWATTLVLQPRLAELGVDIRWMGAVYAVAGVAAIAGSLVSHRFRGGFGVRGSVAAAFTLQVASVALAAAPVAWVALAGIVLHPFALFALDPILRVLLNRRVGTLSRATVLSVVSLTSTLLLLGGRPVVGLVAEGSTAGQAYLVWAAIGAVLFALSFLLTSGLRGSAAEESADALASPLIDPR